MEKTAVLTVDDNVIKPADPTDGRDFQPVIYMWDIIEPVDEVIKHINQKIRI